MNKIDLSTWNRREHFAFFSQFDEPFFSIVSEVDCTVAYRKAKEHGIPFFIWYLYQSLQAVNLTEPFRYRIIDDEVVVFDEVHASSTVARDDHTFGFTFMPYREDMKAFVAEALPEIERVQQLEGLCFDEQTSRTDVIHYSSIPWINFTALTHARHNARKDSVPKISFGQYREKEGKLMMPVSISVHHGLMDGYHVGQFLAKFQELLES
ncbi:chloramphenicol acetyltransferase [Prolixibacter denitrificans]|uniref:Chloramphenicol O-acetyltransferase type A n=1 Tax=Prolixibacter denitrificans TaxID=1541063 RepID=A0A2P8CCD2_9BACT|nr:chloramphenicol acetyltransferase [Prolixibacter denitrificans]PSK82637.1 chloramphenicol O-acetyltransferase type A [Prolixibacter denitrificans]GET21539.1 chloramphenicol acetyltransferase [Prolixibacter denitrificans]